MIDARLKADLLRDEGLRLKVYRDSLGFFTIGIGHLLGTTARMTEITEPEASALLAVDVDAAIAMLRLACPFTRDDDWAAREPARWRALVNMAFNRGGHMRDSTTITPAINTAAVTGDWLPVAAAIVASPWAAQVGQRALRIRADLLAGGA